MPQSASSLNPVMMLISPNWPPALPTGFAGFMLRWIEKAGLDGGIAGVSAN